MAAIITTLLVAIAATCLAVTEARTMVTRDLFGNYEHQLAAQAEKTIATFKATYAKDNSLRADFFALDDTALPTCSFIPNLINGTTIGLTLCQPLYECECPTNSICDPFADPVLLGLGACVCGNEFCQPASGFYCVGTAPAFECSATPETTPYTTSRLMRKALM